MPETNQVFKHERYRITSCIERNSSGALYEVFDNVFEKSAVLKEIPVKLKKVVTASQQEELKIAFANEAKILTGLRHESLLYVYDYFSGIDRNYLVMETVEGNLLEKLLEKNKSGFALPEVMSWAEQLLDALGYLHKQTPSVIHRVINPQNIKLTANGKIKLLAFGIAKKDDAPENPAIKNQFFTAETLNYLPLELIFKGLDSASQKVITNSYDEKSEMILKQPDDARSDVYALGATLYHLLTGKPPIDALERSIDILEGKTDPLPPACKINSSVPPEISDVLMKAMEIKRENRFESAIIMRQILRTAFARRKELEARELKRLEEEIILEFPAPPSVSPEKDQQFIEQERLRIEAEQKRQTELIKQKLRESENQRLLAEQRAAEAEKLLREKQAKQPSLQTAAVIDAQLPAKDADAKPSKVNNLKDSAERGNETAASNDDFPQMFAQPQKSNKVWKQMSVAAIIVILLGGAAFGVWHFQVLQGVLPEQTNQSPITTFVDKVVAEPAQAAPMPTAQMPIEPAPVTEAAPTPESPVISESAETPAGAKTSFTKPAYKNKTATLPPAPRTEKPVAPQPKPQPKKEKPVTVDDIISGN
jgi:serine/threonine protein kinase